MPFPYLVAANADLAVQDGHLVLQPLVQFRFGVQFVHHLGADSIGKKS